MKKDLLVVFAVILLVAVLVMGTDFQSVDEYYLTHISDIKEGSDTVTLTISCKEALKNYDNLDEALKSEKYVPNDGFILRPSKYVLRKGDTAFDILYRSARYNRIQLEFQGAEKNPFGSCYIKGINYLYEFSCGENSGWIYTVNGISPNFGCSQYVLKDGDEIEFIYTCSLGTMSYDTD